MESPDGMLFENRRKWREWLEKNHDKSDEIWLIQYRKHTRIAGMSYKEALEEALCFGWIDSRTRRLDDDRFLLRFTPRKPNSLWSKINKETAERMMAAGQMTPAGLSTIEEAKRNGRWQSAYTSRDPVDLPRDLEEALRGDEEAWRNFNRFAYSYQTQYSYWVLSAKKDETRKKRIAEVVRRSAENRRPGVDP
ncbi:MAG: YdeI/OmpD-associated family protein [Deltaproteobacteria bacterium]|nr:YdeI/OmpD-associated family protein [Deltaproteobacteria bacterium]